jgi:hypothetical protein
MADPYAVSRPQAPIPVGDRAELPLDPATGYLGISVTVEPPPPVAPTVIIYETPVGSGPPPAGFETSSTIPSAAPPASLTSIIAMLSPEAATPLFIQIFQGVAAPAPSDTPFLVGDVATQPGGNTQFEPPNELNRVNGFTVVVSSTQSYFTPVEGDPLLRTVALGR